MGEVLDEGEGRRVVLGLRPAVRLEQIEVGHLELKVKEFFSFF